MAAAKQTHLYSHINPGTCGIYGIVGASGRVYVGQGADVLDRIKSHLRTLARGKHSSPRLQRAWARDGYAAFKVIILEECPADGLTACEQRWIDHYAAQDLIYNASLAAGCTRGFKHSDEFKAKRRQWMLENNPNNDPEIRAKKSATMKGRRPAQSTIEALKAALTGKKRSDEFKEACRQGQTGRVHSEESRKKRSEKLKGRVMSEETRLKMSLAAKVRVKHNARKDAETGRFTSQEGE